MYQTVAVGGVGLPASKSINIVNVAPSAVSLQATGPAGAAAAQVLGAFEPRNTTMDTLYQRSRGRRHIYA